MKTQRLAMGHDLEGPQSQAQSCVQQNQGSQSMQPISQRYKTKCAQNAGGDFVKKSGTGMHHFFGRLEGGLGIIFAAKKSLKSQEIIPNRREISRSSRYDKRWSFMNPLVSLPCQKLLAIIITQTKSISIIRRFRDAHCRQPQEHSIPGQDFARLAARAFVL